MDSPASPCCPDRYLFLWGPRRSAVSKCQHGWFLKADREEMKTWPNLLIPTPDTLTEELTGTTILGNEIALFFVQDVIHWYTSSFKKPLNHFLYAKSFHRHWFHQFIFFLFPSPPPIHVIFERWFWSQGGAPKLKSSIFWSGIYFPSSLDILHFLDSFLVPLIAHPVHPPLSLCVCVVY